MSIFTQFFGGQKAAEGGGGNPADGGNNQNPGQNKNPQGQQSQNPAGMNQQGAGTRQSSRTEANGVVPGNSNESGGDGDSQNEPKPFDKFGEVWQPKATDKNAKSPTADFDVDPKQILEAARRTDFRKLVKPEQLAVIAKGGEESVGALMEVINDIGQNIYAQSATASTRISKATYEKAMKDVVAQLPQHLRKYVAGDSLRSRNQLLSNPAVKPIADGLTEQLTQKYPDASPKEIEDMAMNFFDELGKHFAPKPSEDGEGNSGNLLRPRKEKEADWSNFL